MNKDFFGVAYVDEAGQVIECAGDRKWATLEDFYRACDGQRFTLLLTQDSLQGIELAKCQA